MIHRTGPALLFTLALCCGIAAAGAAPSQSPAPGEDEAAPSAVPVPDHDEADIEALYGRLAAATDAAEAAGIEGRIRAGWMKAGGDTIALLMSRAMGATLAGDRGLAMDLLDAVTSLDPDFAEAWSQRATIHYLEEDYGKALGELERALALEPRHFGALADMGLVLKELGEKARAYEFLERALDLNPFLGEARKALDKLEPEVRGRDI